LSNGVFKDETRMHPRARKLQQNGHKRHSIALKTKTAKTRSFLFSPTVAVQTLWPYQWLLYYVTLPVHSHAEVKIVTSYLWQSVSCDQGTETGVHYGGPGALT